MALEKAAVRIPDRQRVAAVLKIGTVDGLEGQERGLILFSPCVGPRSPQSGLTLFSREMPDGSMSPSLARAPSR